MLGCPLLVALSGRVGRLAVLRTCLAGNALASLLTASASGLRGIFFARCLRLLTLTLTLTPTPTPTLAL